MSWVGDTEKNFAVCVGVWAGAGVVGVAGRANRLGRASVAVGCLRRVR